MRRFLLGLPICLIISGSKAEEIEKLLDNIVHGDKLSLSSKFDSDRQCIIPLGSIAPYGEANNIFKTENIVFTSPYNSDNYWFIALYNKRRNAVTIHPIRGDVLAYKGEDIVCSDNIVLLRTGNEVSIAVR